MHFTRTYPRIIFTQPGLGIATLKTVITLLSVSPIGKCCPQHHWSMICGKGAGSGRRWCLDQAAPSGDLSAFISILFPTPTTSLGFSWCSYHPAWVTDCVNHFKMPESASLENTLKPCSSSVSSQVYPRDAHHTDDQKNQKAGVDNLTLVSETP